MKILVLFLFLATLNGWQNNIPQIRRIPGDSWYTPTEIYRFEDKDNVCYVARNFVGASQDISTAISCVKAGR